MLRFVCASCSASAVFEFAASLPAARRLTSSSVMSFNTSNSAHMARLKLELEAMPTASGQPLRTLLEVGNY